MKIRILFTIAITLLLFGCKKNEATNQSTIEPPNTTFVRGLNNGVAWNGDPKANFQTGTDSVFVQGSNWLDVLQLKFKFDGARGKYTLTADQWNYYWTFGEVIIRAKYYLRTDVASTITVTGYDPAGKILTGTFDLHLIKTQGTIATDPQNIDFTNGAFNVHLSQ